MDSVAVEVEGHVTVVRFWGSPERGAPAGKIKHVKCVGGPHSAPLGKHIVICNHQLLVL